MALRRMTLTLPEAADLLGIPHSTAYDQARTGRFAMPVIKSGSVYRVARVTLEALVGPVELPGDPQEACDTQ